MKIDEMLVLSTGEVLCEFSDTRLKELSGNANKLARTLGRTAHYERKNRTNIECLEADLRLIEEEIFRRRHFTTLTLCAIVWHWHDTKYRIEGKYAEKGEIPLKYHRWAVQFVSKKTGAFAYWSVRHPIYDFVREAMTPYRFYATATEHLCLTGHELSVARRKGAKIDRLHDPLASPWTVADSEDAPWIVGEDEGGE